MTDSMLSDIQGVTNMDQAGCCGAILPNSGRDIILSSNVG
jgi:hypothetical protein